MSAEMVPVTDVVREGRGVTTLRFPYGRDVVPGQFVMVWVPGVDEVPMSVSYAGESWGITVKEIGEATRALSGLRVGDRIGIRGPYGRGFQLPEGQVLCVGGGVGIPPLLLAAERRGDPSAVDVAMGARTADEVIFVERAQRASGDVRISTDDGTRGMKGTVVSLAARMMAEKSYAMVLGCGPEVMNRFLLKACQEAGVPCQLSLERYMKCGCGLCGSCVIDGQRVCADGPVFRDDELAKMPEFGRFRRDEAGRRIKA